MLNWKWIVSTKVDFSPCFSQFLVSASHHRPPLLSPSCALHPSPWHFLSLSPSLLSLKLLFSRSHTHCFSDTCLLTNSGVCELVTCTLCVRVCVAEISPSCTSGVINMGDPNTVIGCGPGREGWGAKKGQWREVEVEAGGGSLLPCSLHL